MADLSRTPTIQAEGSTPAPARSSEGSDIKEKQAVAPGPVAGSFDEKAGAPELVATQDGADAEDRYVTGRKLAVIFSALLLTIFLVALDQTIVATALPKIVSEFNALDKVTWVASAYFLTQAGFMLFFGQLLTFATTKWVYIFLIFIFELGSLICGVAPTMEVLILGRAIAGVGGGGIFVSILTILAQITRLEQRPVLFGMFGGVFAVSSVVGPLLGGAFTDKVTWRWCFYINLPIGGISIAVICLLLKAQPPPANALFKRTGWGKYLELDWVGMLLCLAMTTCLLLPLQWGGTTYPWSDPKVYALFPVFGVLLVAFVSWEYRLGPRAMMPLTMFKRRTQIGCCLEAFFLMLGLLMATYYLPLWYQATQGDSATKSGLDILPYMLSIVVGAGLGGGLISRFGRYWPFLFCSPLLFSVGAGLLYSVNEHTPHAKLIGFQILYGIGIGGALQNTVIAIQAEFADDESMIPQATSLVNFTQLLGGVIGIAIAGTLFDNQLRANIPSTLPPDIVTQVIGSVEVIKALAEPARSQVIAAYAKSLQPVFIIGVPAGALACLSSLLISNYNLKERGSLAGHAGMA